MKTSKSKGKWPPTNGDDGDDKNIELLMKIIDLQSRCIEALALAVGAVGEHEDDDEDEDKETEE